MNNNKKLAGEDLVIMYNDLLLNIGIDNGELLSKLSINDIQMLHNDWMERFNTMKVIFKQDVLTFINNKAN
jgi:hypothetical protein